MLAAAPLLVAASAPGPDAGRAGNVPAPTALTPEDRKLAIEFHAACNQGTARYLARDFHGAVEGYRKAITLSPKEPLGHYYLGVAQVSAGNFAEAEASLGSAERFTPARDGALLAKVLYARADLLERQNRLSEARALWTRYATIADSGGDAGVYPKSAEGRIAAIDRVVAANEAAERVKQRIAETRDGGVFTTLDAGKK